MAHSGADAAPQDLSGALNLRAVGVEQAAVSDDRLQLHTTPARGAGDGLDGFDIDLLSEGRGFRLKALGDDLHGFSPISGAGIFPTDKVEVSFATTRNKVLCKRDSYALIA
jgi:hypothetical protein